MTRVRCVQFQLNDSVVLSLWLGSIRTENLLLVLFIVLTNFHKNSLVLLWVNPIPCMVHCKSRSQSFRVFSSNSFSYLFFHFLINSFLFYLLIRKLSLKPHQPPGVSATNHDLETFVRLYDLYPAYTMTYPFCMIGSYRGDKSQVKLLVLNGQSPRVQNAPSQKTSPWLFDLLTVIL